MILKIEVLIALEWFTVEFESEGITRNKIISIKHEGFLLDLNKLPLTHPEHYEKIGGEVTKEAEKYWNKSGGCKGLTGVPTLDAYLNKYMGLCVVLLALTSCSPKYSMMQQKMVVTSINPFKVRCITGLMPLNLKVGDTITMITKVRGMKQVPNAF